MANRGALNMFSGLGVIRIRRVRVGVVALRTDDTGFESEHAVGLDMGCRRHC